MKTGLVRWEWHSLDHVGAAESEVEAPSDATPWDWFHLNSIDPEPDGDILISARSTWAGYQLAGRQRQDPLAPRRQPRAPSRWGRARRRPGSTTARMLPDGEVTFFDDGSNPPIHSQSRAMRDRARPRDPHSAPRRRLHAPRPAAARRRARATCRRCPTATRVVGYGGVPEISEYATDGSLLFDAHLPYDMVFYRAFRYPWSAQPAEPAGGARQPQQHRRRDDRARELERRDRRRLLARARRQQHRGVADGAGDGRRERLRELDDPAQDVRLRRGPGARLRRPRARRARRPSASISYAASLPGDGSRSERALSSRAGVVRTSCGSCVLVRRARRRACVVGVLLDARRRGELAICRRTRRPRRRARQDGQRALAWRSVAFCLMGRAPVVAGRLGRLTLPGVPRARDRRRRGRVDERRGDGRRRRRGAEPGCRAPSGCRARARHGCWPSAAWRSSWSSST